MDVWAVREAAEAAVARARDGQGPQFIQAMTYRFVGHSRSDPGKYRKPGELDEWRRRDPLLVAREGLAVRYGVAEPTLEQVEQDVSAQLADMRTRGVAAPYPAAADNTPRHGVQGRIAGASGTAGTSVNRHLVPAYGHLQDRPVSSVQSREPIARGGDLDGPRVGGRRPSDWHSPAEQSWCRCPSAWSVASTDHYFVVNVALVTIALLGCLARRPRLVVAGYRTVYAALLVIGGRSGDRFGRRRVFATGLAAFVVTSLSCGLAPSADSLVGFRLLQGASAALIVPQVVATFQATLEGGRRARAQSLYGATAGGAIVVGQLIGGLLVSANIAGTGWRPIFLINVPIGLVALGAVMRVVPETRAPHRELIDVPGAVSFAATMAALLLPLTLGQTDGWPAWSWVMLASAPLLGLLTIAIERRTERRGLAPLLAPSVLRLTSVRRGLALHLPFMLGYGAFMFVFALLVQQGLHADPSQAGLAIMPMAALFFGISLFVPQLVNRFGAKNVTALGSVILALGLGGLLATVSVGWPHVELIMLAPSLVVVGAGQALTFGCLFRLILADVPAQHAGMGGGILVTMQQAGLALGVATLGTAYVALRSHGTPEAFAVITAVQMLIAVLVVVGSRRMPTSS